MKYWVVFILLIFLLCASRQEEENSKSINCSNRGIYLESIKECRCIPGYETYPKNSASKCNYELRSKSVALFFSVFGGLIGADRFYLGHVMKGIIKSLVPVCVAIFILRIQYNKGIQSKKFSYYLSLFPIFLSIIVWLIDIVFISCGKLQDENGFNLYE